VGAPELQVKEPLVQTLEQAASRLPRLRSVEYEVCSDPAGLPAPGSWALATEQRRALVSEAVQPADVAIVRFAGYRLAAMPPASVSVRVAAASPSLADPAPATPDQAPGGVPAEADAYVVVVP
jgi:hypothetical protein